MGHSASLRSIGHNTHQAGPLEGGPPCGDPIEWLLVTISYLSLELRGDLGQYLGLSLRVGGQSTHQLVSHGWMPCNHHPLAREHAALPHCLWVSPSGSTTTLAITGGIQARKLVSPSLEPRCHLLALWTLRHTQLKTETPLLASCVQSCSSIPDRRIRTSLIVSRGCCVLHQDLA